MCYFHSVNIAIDGDVTFCSECYILDFKATDSKTKENVISKTHCLTLNTFD